MRWGAEIDAMRYGYEALRLKVMLCGWWYRTCRGGIELVTVYVERNKKVNVYVERDEEAS